MNIDKICEQLTIDEKIRLLGGVGDWHTYDCNGKIPSIMMTDINFSLTHELLENAENERIHTSLKEKAVSSLSPPSMAYLVTKVVLAILA